MNGLNGAEWSEWSEWSSIPPLRLDQEASGADGNAELRQKVDSLIQTGQDEGLKSVVVEKFKESSLHDEFHVCEADPGG